MKFFVLVTHNLNKLQEIKDILGVELECESIDLTEIQSVELEEVATFKAKQAYERLGKPVMVEDTGLFIEAWGGLPGAFIKWFKKSVGESGICSMMEGFPNRRAVAKTVVAIYDGQMTEPLTFAGEVEGEIARVPAGERSFGFDSIFIPLENNEDRLTFAQMGEEKTKYSMRRKAFEDMRDYYSRNKIRSDT